MIHFIRLSAGYLFDKNNSVTPYVFFDKDNSVTPYVFFHDGGKKNNVTPSTGIQS